MPRLFFHDSIFSMDENLILSKDESVHLREVVKNKIGDEIIITNGKGLKAKALIESLSPDVTIKIISINQEIKKSNELHLFQGCLNSSKMELVIQKITELGVCSFTPLLTEKSLIDFKNDKKIESKLKRWSKISLEALKQSGRSVALDIAFPQKLRDSIEKLQKEGASFYFLNEYGGKSPQVFSDNLAKQKPYNIFIGPESGWSLPEVTQMLEAGGEPITLGDAILRAETASIAIASFLMIRNITD